MNAFRTAVRPAALAAGLLWAQAGLAAQVEWNDVSPATGPALRVAHAMAYDPLRGVTLLFGGHGAVLYGDTWEWDGSTWTQRTPAHAPSARRYSQMVFDRARGVMVLFGGRDLATTRFNDTWEWDGSDWTQRNPATRPSGRNGHAMAYDTVRARTVLFGGTPNGSDETWEYDGTTWVQRTPNPHPAARASHGMVWDAVRQRCVMFGGVVAGPVYYNDTWEWDGTSWTQRTPLNRPSTRQDMAMSHDAMRGVVLLYGGYRPTGALGDTWEFDGVDWTQRSPLATPGLRYQAAMAWDELRRVAVFALGTTGAVAPQDTWTYGPVDPPEYALLGSGCPGSAGTPTIATNDLGPFADDTFSIRIDQVPAPALGATVGLLGFSDEFFGMLALPAELGEIGMPGCILRNDIGAPFVLPVVGNTATWDLTIPATPPLVGLRFFQQALCFDAAANAAGMTLSNQGRGLVGGR